MSLVEYQYVIAIALGFMLGIAELMGRYRDDPITIFRCKFAWFYVLLNGVLSGIALFLIEKLGLSFTPADVSQTQWSDALFNVMTAGFGGAAFFRSSIMKAKSGDTDIAIGPAIVIDTLLSVTDREVDRYRAIIRSQEITKQLQYVTLREMSMFVVPFCQDLMQNLSASEREKVNKELVAREAEAAKPGRSKEASVLSIGLLLVEFTSFAVLEAAIDELRNKEFLPSFEDAKKRAQETRQKAADAAGAEAADAREAGTAPRARSVPNLISSAFSSRGAAATTQVPASDTPKPAAGGT